MKKNLLKKALVALTIAGITLTSPMEAYATEEYGYTYVSRTYMDAPDVDGYLFIMDVPYDLMSGQFVDVLITGSNDYDLVGELVKEGDEDEFTE